MNRGDDVALSVPEQLNRRPEELYRASLRRASPRGRPLSAQEIAVLKRRARGGPAKTTARDLGISEKTVKNHITNALRKLDCTSVVEAFVALGWLVVPSEDDRDELRGRRLTGLRVRADRLQAQIHALALDAETLATQLGAA